MDIPRGHAAMPLQEADFLDFIYNYFKAEYAPIRSFWSTATADPRQPSRWFNMGHELSPLAVRPANAQAQKDLESLDYFARKWNLDAGFVKGLVIRFAKYEVHERLEKKLFECARLDLMVRKSLKEKHLIDALWPSPAPKNLPHELLQQGVQVRKWYGDMFNKYFRVLHSVDSFELRPEVDLRIKNSGTLMLIPFVDHLVFGAVDPIMPIVAKGAGYSNAKGWERRDKLGFGEPGRFEIRFDAPAEVTDTYTKSVVRQCQCMKCGTRRDVQVVVSVDPNPNAGATASTSSPSSSRNASTSAPRRQTSKAAQRYAPGYVLPSEQEAAPPRPPRPQTQESEPPRALSPERKKQCPRCTFLNHPELTACEMCQADLPDATIPKPPSPAAVKKPSHSHSASVPPPTTANTRTAALKEEVRPAAPNRHSLSQSLFSIFPFSQQHQQEHHAKLPETQQVEPSSTTTLLNQQSTTPSKQTSRPPSKAGKQPKPESPTTSHQTDTPSQYIPPRQDYLSPDPETPLSRAPEMAMMPLTPSPPSSSTFHRPAPAGLPSNLMDDFVPVSPSFPREEEDEDAGWGEMSRAEARRGEGGGAGDNDDDSSSDEDGEEGEGRRSGGLIDLDAVAREEADVWGEERDD
ncbi:Nn.00g021590.m01.CDS01 [Neocucurbitaria sp. VM-36]